MSSRYLEDSTVQPDERILIRRPAENVASCVRSIIGPEGLTRAATTRFRRPNAMGSMPGIPQRENILQPLDHRGPYLRSPVTLSTARNQSHYEFA